MTAQPHSRPSARPQARGPQRRTGRQRADALPEGGVFYAQQGEVRLIRHRQHLASRTHARTHARLVSSPVVRRSPARMHVCEAVNANVGSCAADQRSSSNSRRADGRVTQSDHSKEPPRPRPLCACVHACVRARALAMYLMSLPRFLTRTTVWFSTCAGPQNGATQPPSVRADGQRRRRRGAARGDRFRRWERRAFPCTMCSPPRRSRASVDAGTPVDERKKQWRVCVRARLACVRAGVGVDGELTACALVSTVRPAMQKPVEVLWPCGHAHKHTHSAGSEQLPRRRRRRRRTGTGPPHAGHNTGCARDAMTRPFRMAGRRTSRGKGEMGPVTD